jgi:hypothetical protein
MEICKGSHITARHKTGSFHFFRVVEDMNEKGSPVYRLLNINSDNLMANFKSHLPEDAEKYVKEYLQLDIIKIS